MNARRRGADRGGTPHVDTAAIVFAAVVAALHLVIYITVTGSPLDASPLAWEGWWDQSQYLRSAMAFAGGSLAPAEHWYALGYPLLAVPFLALLPKDPFFAINLVSLVAFALAFLAYFRPAIGALPAMAVFLVAQLLPGSVEAPHLIRFPVWLQYVIPWNTTPVAALLMIALVVVRGLDAGDRPRKDALLGILASVVVTIRPSDALPLLVAGVFYFRQRVLRERAVAHVSAAVGGAAAVLGLYCALSWAIYGGLATPYHDEVRAIGASVSDLHERAYAILIDAGTTHGEPRAALAALQPWLLLAIPLAVAWAAVDAASGLLVVGAAAVSLISYICFNDFWPYALLRLSLVHYVAWTLPVLAGAGVAGAMATMRTRRWVPLGAALTAAALVALLRVAGVPLATTRIAIEALPNGYTRYEIELDRAQDVDAIDFIGAATADPRGVTLKAFDVSADGRPLPLFSGHRPIQLPDRLRLTINRHVEASRLTVVLDNTIAHHPAAAANVQVVAWKFRGSEVPGFERFRGSEVPGFRGAGVR